MTDFLNLVLDAMMSVYTVNLQFIKKTLYVYCALLKLLTKNASYYQSDIPYLYISWFSGSSTFQGHP